MKIGDLLYNGRVLGIVVKQDVRGLDFNWIVEWYWESGTMRSLISDESATNLADRRAWDFL
jgi:hypothetical protein